MLRILLCAVLVSLTASLPIHVADRRRPLTALGACSSDAVCLRRAPVPTPATYLPVNKRRVALDEDDGDNFSTTSTDDSAIPDHSTTEDVTGVDATAEGDDTAAGDDTTTKGDDSPAGDDTSTDGDDTVGDDTASGDEDDGTATGDEDDGTGDDGEQSEPDGGDDGEVSGSGNSTGGGEYHLVDMFKGADFFEQWEFFSGKDPTDGLVNFLTVDEARSQNLSYVDDDGAFWMAVDDSTTLDAGQNRNSIRINSKKTYNDALIIAHIERMPHGCSVWPAWWTVGDDWPNKGEVDILEGVHNQETNQYTYHTGPGCTLDDSVKMTGNVLNTECTVGGGNNRGCGMTDQSRASYGEGFNQGGGGVFAQLRDSEGIRIWFFPRDSIPEDIESNAPKPATWDTPASFLANGDKCPVETQFVDHVLTFDITLCGQWAGDPKGFEDAGCSGTCAETVQNPENYRNAKWKVRYVATYTSEEGEDSVSGTDMTRER